MLVLLGLSRERSGCCGGVGELELIVVATVVVVVAVVEKKGGERT